MTKTEAIALLGPIAEALTTLLIEVPKVEEPKPTKKKDKKEKPKKEEVKAEDPPVADETDDFFGDDSSDGGGTIEVKTPAEVKTLVVEWINSDPDKNRDNAQKVFTEITGLGKMKEVTDKNATEVYGKLVEGYKK